MDIDTFLRIVSHFGLIVVGFSFLMYLILGFALGIKNERNRLSSLIGLVLLFVWTLGWPIIFKMSSKPGT